MFWRLVIFLLINFAGLAIGGLFTGPGVNSDWYAGLDQAPWMPPGWLFGPAWTFIMICFGFYLAYLWPRVENKSLLIGLYALQWIFNVGWNPVFFYYQQVLAALLVIGALTLLIGFFLFFYRKELKVKSLLLLPYFLWLIIAFSLNAYIYFNN